MTDLGEKRISVLWMLPIAVAVFAACWTYMSFQQKRLGWHDAVRIHQESLVAAQEIQRLTSSPQYVALTEDAAATISDLIENSAKDRLQEGQLRGIQAEPQRRIGRTDYLTIPTQIQLRNVALHECASFASQLENARQGLLISEFELLQAVSPGAGGTERWDVNLKLTQTIYSANVSQTSAR